jgi:hypothetical protein
MNGDQRKVEELAETKVVPIVDKIDITLGMKQPSVHCHYRMMLAAAKVCTSMLVDPLPTST